MHRREAGRALGATGARLCVGAGDAAGRQAQARGTSLQSRRWRKACAKFRSRRGSIARPCDLRARTRRGRASPATITRTSGQPSPSQSGNPLNTNRLRHLFARLLKRAGLPGHHTPYSLRHTYNALLYVSGAQGQPPCALMGHAHYMEATPNIHCLVWLPYRASVARDREAAAGGEAGAGVLYSRRETARADEGRKRR